MADHRIPFALGPDGQVASVHDVPRGLPCRCTCPCCGARLVAKKGPIQVAHFAHEKGADCANALESSIHLAVKSLLERERQMLVPACVVTRCPDHTWSPMRGYDTPAIDPYIYSASVAEDWTRRVVAGVAGTSERLLRFDRVLVERSEGDIRPDLIAETGDRRLYIEVAVTHRVDLDKLLKIRAKRTSAIEIRVPYGPGADLSWETLRTLVVEQTTGKIWLYHPVLEERADRLHEELAPAREKARRREELQRQREQERQQRRAEWRAAKRRAQAEQRAAEAAARRAEEERLQAEAARRATEALEAQQRDPEYQARQAALRAEDAARLERMRQRMRETYAQAIEDFQVASAARDAELQAAADEVRRSKEAAEQEAQAARDVLLARLRSGPPSSDHPMDSQVLCLDLDGVLLPNAVGLDRRVQALARVLRDLPCSIVVTSHSHDLAAASDLLAPLGGRHLAITPVLDIEDPRACRTREIAVALSAYEAPEAYILSPQPCGVWPGWTLHLTRPGGLGESDIPQIRSWLQRCIERATGSVKRRYGPQSRNRPFSDH